MKLLYISFFTVLGLVLFNILSKPILKLRLKILFSILIVAFCLLQISLFYNLGYMDNNKFFILLVFSFVVFVFYYGINFLLILFLNKRETFQGNYLAKGFLFFRNYIIYLLIWLFQVYTILSLSQQETFTKEKLIGSWKIADKKHSTIILEINKKNVTRIENGKKIIYSNYAISGNTLILVNSKFKEKHLIVILTDSKLRFGAVNPYEKDIELIDAVEFEKINIK
ncbi:hypothetical protein EYY60_08015 [Flavobacterium zhairuonense]|uniref:hypothetical protein n=1 Tax=Flavobacterium zhairuonense TaxID=2493631 RepID=UPI001053ACFD|nr:hypothetical protein [Flavobacterium zhairuonense]KAF2511367.1 hypothetical protein EYY60_08015 [Flavobacterium zhairuonense]